MTGKPNDELDSEVRTDQTLWTRVIALARLIQPTFLVPAVAIAALGGLLAPDPDLVVLVGHAVAVGLAVYAAHLRDALVDRFQRQEEPPGGTTPRMLRQSFTVTTTAFWTVVAGLWVAVGPAAALVVGPLWVLAALHAPYLDVTPIGSATDYAAGVALSLAGGYVLQTGTVSGPLLVIAGTLGTALVAVTVSVDSLDVDFDRAIGKQTIPVMLGSEQADRLAAALFLASGAFIVLAVAYGMLPFSALPAAAVSSVAAASVFARPRRRAVIAQMAALYPFLTLLVVPVCLSETTACGGLLRTIAHF